MKKVISFMFAILMICSMGIYMVQAVAADAVVKISDSPASPGAKVEIFIKLDCPKGIKTITFYDFVYDDTKLELVKSECCWLADGILKDIDFDNNASIITFVSNTAYSDNMLKLVFNVADDVEAGTIPVSCSVIGTRMINNVETVISIDFTSGSVVIGSTVGLFNYRIIDDGIVITGYNGTESEVEIQENYEINGKTYNVVGIDESAFKCNNSITGVTIPKMVRFISTQAFYDCKALRHVTVLGEKTTIGEKSLGYYLSNAGDCIVENFTINGYSGSTAETYAKENNISFIDLSHIHSYTSKITKSPTCTKTGVRTYTCSCGDSYTKVIAKLGHSYGSYKVTKKATCTEKGTKTKTCSTCGNKVTATIKATGHTYKTTTTKATTSKAGSVVTKCTVCGNVKSKKTIAKIKSVTLSSTSYTYNGKVKTPTVTVKDANGKKFAKGTDYTVSYASGRKNVGKYTVKVTFKGNYSGSKTLTFKIVPKGTSISKLTSSKKKQLTVTWAKQAKQTSGYEIQYSTSKKMKSAKTVTIEKAKTTSKTVKSLKSGKTYYVRIRTFKTVNGTKIYSSWSSAKKIKVK